MTLRRDILAMSAAGAVAAGLPHDASGQTRSHHTFLLIHGAWHGGWCWRYVADILRADGHTVFTPTMTGLGERVHLRSPKIDFETHVTDIMNVIKFEELDRFVLVGHSYGGPIVSAVCDRLRERVAHAIYLDAITPKDGETIFPGGTIDAVQARFGELIDGYLAPPGDPAGFGVTDATPELKAWVTRHLTPHLLGTWIQPVRLPNGGSDGLPRTFIYCSDKPAISAQAQARLDAFKADQSWVYAELPTGHDSMVTMPRETAELFVAIADGRISGD